MKSQSISLRQAVASNPMRFSVTTTPRSAPVLRLSIERHRSRPFSPAPQPIDAEADPVSDQLRGLGLHGMARAVARAKLASSGDGTALIEGLSLLVEAEIAERRKRRVAGRLRSARLRYQATEAEVDYNAVRGFDDALFHWLALGGWIADKDNVIIDGPTGVGKTWLACALGEKACRDDRSVRYERVPRLLAELNAVRGSGRYSHRMRTLHNTELLILDDWGLEPLGPEQRHDLLEIIEDRYGNGSTLIASQAPVELWSQTIGDAGVAAVILDRLTHNAHRLQLRGESLRAQHKDLRTVDVAT
jgi:DNA replication protein DnaC